MERSPTYIIALGEMITYHNREVGNAHKGKRYEYICQVLKEVRKTTSRYSASDCRGRFHVLCGLDYV